MSRMIPPFYDESTTSNGEKKFFKTLKQLPDNYAILHSLGLANHNKKVFAEIDFVIVCSRGILCLEVKGGFVRREEGAWCFTNKHGKENKKAEGPYEQVLSAMHSLRGHLSSNFGNNDPITRCLYACGVVFPDMPFTQTGPDIITETTFDSRGRQENIGEYINKVFDYWTDLLREKHGITSHGLSVSNLNRVINYLRGDFGFVPSLGYIVERTEENLLTLTREQVDRLSIASENKRILLKGGAGTGKTLLSLEYARRAALKGNKVLYLCYNRNLCLYLKSIIEEELPDLGSVVVDTFHGYLIEQLKNMGHEFNKNQFEQDQFYSDILPETFVQTVSQSGCGATYDTLVIDEGQDLLQYEYIMCLDYLLEGGFRGGNWHICYDPNQSIYNSFLQDGLTIIQEYFPTRLSLDTNCRNTRPIGVYNTLLTGLKPTRFFRVDGESVVKKTFSDFSDQRRQLVKEIKRLIGQGIRPGSIVLLSKYKFENSCLEGKNIFGKFSALKDISSWAPRGLQDNCIKFSTIHGFKGLESPVIFLLDIDRFEDLHSRMLNYTGMSRAKSLLYLFCQEDAGEEMNNAVSNFAELLKEIEG